MATQVDEATKYDLSAEVAEWIEAFDDVVAHDWNRARRCCRRCGRVRARQACRRQHDYHTFCNTIPKYDEVPTPATASWSVAWRR